MEKLLKENPQSDRIDGHFAADPFMAGCKCFLGPAADAGFNAVESRMIKGKIQKFNKQSVVKVCENFQKKKIFGNAKILKIKK